MLYAGVSKIMVGCAGICKDVQRCGIDVAVMCKGFKIVVEFTTIYNAFNTLCLIWNYMQGLSTSARNC